MTTVVLPERECASACVFILMAGVTRIPTNLAHVELHRPRFDPVYFANLTAQQASTKYNTLVEELRKHFIDEMGGSEQTFRLMMSTPSDELQTLIVAELEEFGLRGQDPAWGEYLDAQNVKYYGPVRWPFINRCIAPSGDIDGCVKKAYEKYPDN